MSIRPKNKEPYDYLVKVLILGDSAVGKSALLMKFCDDQFLQSHIATIGVDFKYKTLDCEGKKYRLQIWDTAGQEKFRSIVQTYFQGAMGIILVYSINDRKSFENIENWMRQIPSNTQQEPSIVLVGNKSDLVDRVIQTSEGEKIAEQYNVKFFETSAKSGQNVENAFYQLTKDVKEKVGDNPIVVDAKKSLVSNSNSRDTLRLVPSIQPQEEALNQKKCNC